MCRDKYGREIEGISSQCLAQIETQAMNENLLQLMIFSYPHTYGHLSFVKEGKNTMEKNKASPTNGGGLIGCHHIEE